MILTSLSTLISSLGTFNCVSLSGMANYSTGSDAYSTFVTLKEGAWTVGTPSKLPEGAQPQITVEELIGAEKCVKSDGRVQALLEEIGAIASAVTISVPVSSYVQALHPKKSSAMVGP